MKKILVCITSCLALLSATTIASAQNISTTAYGSDAGFGQIDYNPGVNVSQYVIYGNGSPYAYSSGGALSTVVSGDGTPVFGGPYTPTYFTWNNGVSGTTGGTSGSTDNVQPNGIGGVEPLSTGYGTTPWTTVSISLTAPASDFTVDFVAHDYYANANLTVTLNNQTFGTFDSIMSSSGSRNTDFLFHNTVQGVNVGDTLNFTFDGLANLGSSWANIDLFAASVNLTLPSNVTDTTQTTLSNITPVPEPASLTLAILGGAGLLFLRRRK